MTEEGDNAARAVHETRRLATLQTWLAEMGKGTVLVHTVTTDDTLYIVLATPHTIVTKNSAIDRKELDRLTSEFFRVLANSLTDPRPVAKRLYDVLLAPVADELKGAGARTIMLSLDGRLRDIPVAALWTGERWVAE
ncbi:MAG: CHAT domain-containing protein, partial [Deltaproteobacteria bacterium]|nr:CHAT domain-containing protein [Deltaproteobacteria bacterium]